MPSGPVPSFPGIVGTIIPLTWHSHIFIHHPERPGLLFPRAILMRRRALFYMVNIMYRAMLGKTREGSTAPPISAMDIRGEKFDTREHLNKNDLVIFFYRGHWCSTCGEELKNLKREYDGIRKLGAEIVAISTDSPDEAKNLAVNLGLPFKVISDPDHRIIDSYDVYDRENGTAFITLFILDRTGTIRYKRIVEGPENMFSAEEIVDRLKDIREAA